MGKHGWLYTEDTENMVHEETTMPFMIDTQVKGLYVIAEDSITHYFLSKSETSPGLLVKKHYDDIERALHIAWYIREGKCHESVSAYWHKEEDLEDSIHLEPLVKALEEQVDLFTEGAYRQLMTAKENGDRESEDQNRYWREIQEILAEINALKEKRYYENEIHHRPGVPRIETVGRRLVDRIVDLVWRMDNNAPSMQEEIFEAIRRADEKSSIFK
jgi:hypothetical protein